LEHSDKPLVLIVGPTGVGKSAAALDLAETYGGEIINGDSMQVYRGFDVGTDKPSAEDRRRIPHHLIDILDPSAQFTAADFAAGAFAAALGILNRGGLPFVVGGTGLYIKALLDGLFPGPGRDPAVRAALEEEARSAGLAALHARLAAADPAYAAKVGPRDRVRIVRALEVLAVTGEPLSSHFRRTESRFGEFSVLRIGLALERAELYRRIEGRTDRMFERGFVEEVRGLLAAGVDERSAPFKALGYKSVLAHLKGEIPLERAVELTKTDTRHYAKRQLTWFRKMEGLQWMPAGDRDGLAALVREAWKERSSSTS
jgi:tRNA dimethylallyltransferase